MQCQIVDDFFSLMDSIKDEQRVPRDYGDGNLLYNSEAELVETIHNNDAMNVSELSAHCGVTKSAITQICNKLIEKGILEKYSVGKNKKERYLRLTEQGETVHEGFLRYHEQANMTMRSYLCALDDDKKAVIKEFIEKVQTNLPLCVFNCSCGGGCSATEEASADGA